MPLMVLLSLLQSKATEHYHHCKAHYLVPCENKVNIKIILIIITSVLPKPKKVGVVWVKLVTR